MLAGHLGAKLVGRTGVSPRVISMLASILEKRYGKSDMAARLATLTHQAVKQEETAMGPPLAANGGLASQGQGTASHMQLADLPQVPGQVGCALSFALASAQ